MRIAIAVVIACVAAGCANQHAVSPVPADQSPSQNEYGPAEKETSIAAGLAEEFMKTEPYAERYSSRATEVGQVKTGIYWVRFQRLDNESKNHAIVRVFLNEKRCLRIPVK